jgi:putative peptidoglycan lipid II flippase
MIRLGHPGVRRVARLMGPRMLGLASGQLNYLVSTVLASGLVTGSLAVYTYAFQLSQLPVGIIGVSVAIALFPTMSRDAALGRFADIRRQVASALRMLLFVAAPLTALMIVLRDPLTAVFYQYGQFTPQDAARTAGALGFFAIGLVAHIVVHVLARAFYAMQDTRTPVTWAIVAVAVNIGLMTALVGPMGVEGLALALSISAMLEVVGLLWSLRRRIDGVDGSAIARSVGRAALAAVPAAFVMAGGLWVAGEIAPDALADPLGRLLVLLLLAAAGAAAFVAVAIAVGSSELDQLRGLLRRRRPAA